MPDIPSNSGVVNWRSVVLEHRRGRLQRSITCDWGWEFLPKVGEEISVAFDPEELSFNAVISAISWFVEPNENPKDNESDYFIVPKIILIDGPTAEATSDVKK